jgi:hypothetical protein
MPDGAAEVQGLLLGEGDLALYLAADPKPPAVWVHPRDRVGEPVGYGMEVAGEARLLARTGDAVRSRSPGRARVRGRRPAGPASGAPPACRSGPPGTLADSAGRRALGTAGSGAKKARRAG